MSFRDFHFASVSAPDSELLTDNDRLDEFEIGG